MEQYLSYISLEVVLLLYTCVLIGPLSLESYSYMVHGFYVHVYMTIPGKKDHSVINLRYRIVIRHKNLMDTKN